MIRPSVVTNIGSEMDMFVTAAALAGASVPSDRMMDGIDLRRLLIGSGPNTDRVLFYYWDNELRAVRKGTFKAHFITSGAYGEGEPRREHNPPLLFNLADDPGERHDIAATHPEIVADLIREVEVHRRHMVAGRPLFDELLPASPGQVR
jgi:arylsulfatase A-like enzyme